MSDFLTRLVTATYQPAAAVRPRPVAHYEPPGAAPSPWVEGDEPLPPAPVAAPPQQTPVAPVRAAANAPTPSPQAPNAPAAAPRTVTPPSTTPLAPIKAAAPLAAPPPPPLRPAPTPPSVATDGCAPARGGAAHDAGLGAADGDTAADPGRCGGWRAATATDLAAAHCSAARRRADHSAAQTACRCTNHGAAACHFTGAHA